MIIFQKYIFRVDLRLNPELTYLFGDNLIRVGMGGQAGEMRGEPNALGVATKRNPGMSDGDFFSDTSQEDELAMRKELANVNALWLLGKKLVIPSDGLGTGLSMLPEKAPKLYKMMFDYFESRAIEDGKKLPWKAPV